MTCPGGTPVDVTWQSPYGWAESGLIATTADLRRFLAALFKGPLLKPAQRAELFTIPDMPYWDGATCPGCGGDDLPVE